MRIDNSDMFRPIHNPYIVGNPIKDQNMFFGREDDFTFIRQKVTGGKKEGGLLVLCGGRRSGKTSILFQIMNGRLGEEFVPVLIDMQAMTVENDLDFLIKLAEGIVDAIGDPDISLEADFLSKRGQGSLAAFQDFIVKINEHLDGRKLILLFDEYEIIESHIAKNLISTDILNLLASWIERKEGVFIVFTGSDKLEERTAAYWDHFLGKALHRRISFLSRSDTLRLITEPLNDVIRYAEGLPEKIYSLTAGQPFYTQVLCQALVDHLNEVRRYELKPENLQDVIGEIIENPLPQMIFSWNSLNAIEKLTLSVTGELNKESARPIRADDILGFVKDEKIGYLIDPGALNETLEKLFHHDMLEKDTGHDAYWFKMDLWRSWVARMHSIWQVVDEIKSSDEELGEGVAVATKSRSRVLLAVGIVAVVAVVAIVYTSLIAPNRGGVANGVLERAILDSTMVTIRTVPAGAWVFLNRERIGRSPVEDRSVPVGEVLLGVELDGYEQFVDTLTLRKDEPFDRSIELVEKTGHLKLTSTPEGADIWLDGQRTDRKTPATIENLPINRRYDVKLSLPQYNAVTLAGIELQEDSTLLVHRNLITSTSQVQIVTTPPGATFSVDGRPLGETPNVFTLTYGSHRLVIQKDGYQVWDHTVTIPVEGDRVTVDMDKLPPGTLVIKVAPYADVYIGNEKKGTGATRVVNTLDPGTYAIELRHPHFGTVTRLVEVASSDTTEVTVDMSKEGKTQ